MGKSLKRSAIAFALVLTPLAAILLRNHGVISGLASDWITVIWLFPASVCVYLFNPRPPKPDPS